MIVWCSTTRPLGNTHNWRVEICQPGDHALQKPSSSEMRLFSLVAEGTLPLWVSAHKGAASIHPVVPLQQRSFPVSDSAQWMDLVAIRQLRVTSHCKVPQCVLGLLWNVTTTISWQLFWEKWCPNTTTSHFACLWHCA